MAVARPFTKIMAKATSLIWKTEIVFAAYDPRHCLRVTPSRVTSCVSRMWLV
jgi:hypothetical protein